MTALSIERKIIAVGPAGQWGSAFAKVAAEKGHEVRLYFRDPEDAIAFQETHRTRRLPGVDMPPNIQATSDKEEFVVGADLVVLAPPSRHLRSFYEEVRVLINPQTDILSLTKGLEQGTNLRMSAILLEKDPSRIGHIAVLSGPNLAKEIARSKIAGTVVAAYNPDVAKGIQSCLNSDRFRVYTSDDPKGVEYGGAFKNVMALGAGMADTLKMPPSTKALYFTRALEEMVRLGTALGAKEITFRGLAGAGDLFLSCSDGATRNYRAGERIVQGWIVEEILTAELAEGLYTIKSVVELALAHKIDVPITSALYDVIYGGLEIHKGINRLMNRQPTEEQLKIRNLWDRLTRLARRIIYNIGINPLFDH